MYDTSQALQLSKKNMEPGLIEFLIPRKIKFSNFINKLTLGVPLELGPYTFPPGRGRFGGGPGGTSPIFKCNAGENGLEVYKCF